MKQGRMLEELARELQAQKESKKDFLAQTPALTVQPQGQIEIPDPQDPAVPLLFGITNHAHTQLAQRLGIPKNYYDRLMKDHPELWAENVNQLFRREPKTRLVRTLYGDMRAVLSNKFRTLDNWDLAEATLPEITKTNCNVVSCEVTPTRMYIKAVSPRIRGEVNVGDEVQQGIVISNSEVGLGSLRIESLLYRLVCKNGMVQGHTKKRIHVGRENMLADEAESAYLSQTAQRLKDAAFWAETVDAMKYILSEDHLEKTLETAREAAGIEIGAMKDVPTRVVGVLGSRFNLRDEETESVLNHLIQGGDLSAWGYTNAVTQASQAIKDYDRATELERIGGEIIQMKEKDWEGISRAISQSMRRQ